MKAKTYMAWANDRTILESSASGGIFQTLARSFLTYASTDGTSGTVYGAWQDNVQYSVKHRGVSTFDGVSLLVGSKYYQSEMKGVYPEIIQKLESNQRVLFSGTPCQIAGLRSYMKACGIVGSDQLLTVEVLCHGISSRKVVMRYKEWLENKSQKEIKDIHFRTKKRRWYDKGSSMEILYGDGSMKIIDRHVDPFYLAFNHNINLRPSCYSCQFAKIERTADITIGDLWGAEDYVKDKQRLKDGISIVMVNSDIGMEFWNRQQDIISAYPIDINVAIPRNGAIVHPAKEPEGRNAFFSELDKLDFDDLVRNSLGNSRLLKIRIKGLIGEKRIKRIKNVIHRDI